MTVGVSRWWSKRGFSVLSLALSLAEVIIIGWALASALKSQQPPAPHIVRLTDTTWLVGGLGSFGLAVAGLVADYDRKTAVFALITTIVISLICGVPLMASA